MSMKRKFRKWIGSRKVQKVLVITTFMAIPLILLFVFTYLPFGKMFGYSFYEMKYTLEVFSHLLL